MAQNRNFFLRLHPMRMALYLFAISSILLRPEIGSELEFEGWTVISSLIVPVLVPIFFMLLMLDALMTRVWLSEAQGTEVERLRNISRIDLLLGILLLAFWIPFFISLG